MRPFSKDLPPIKWSGDFLLIFNEGKKHSQEWYQLASFPGVWGRAGGEGEECERKDLRVFWNSSGFQTHNSQICVLRPKISFTFQKSSGELLFASTQHDGDAYFEAEKASSGKLLGLGRFFWVFTVHICDVFVCRWGWWNFTPNWGPPVLWLTRWVRHTRFLKVFKLQGPILMFRLIPILMCRLIPMTNPILMCRLIPMPNPILIFRPWPTPAPMWQPGLQDSYLNVQTWMSLIWFAFAVIQSKLKWM